MDQQIQCRDCGQEFTFTDGEQQFYASKNLSNPQRCKDCRAKRKAASGGGQFGGGRKMHDAVCTTCGANCQVPFQPRDGMPVLCHPCFKQSRA